MLTDYHVHLRTDGADSAAEDHFTVANAERYQEVAAERESARDDLDAYCEFVRDRTSLALGIEADYIAGTEERMASLLDARDWDYVIGSVHFIANQRTTFRATGATCPGPT